MGYNPFKMLKKALNSKKLLVKIAAAALVFYLLSFLLSFTGIEGFREGADGGSKKVIYFHMEGCPHCVKLNPEWNKFAAEAKIKTEKFESKQKKELQKKFGVEGYPSVIMVKDGKKVAELAPDARTKAGLNDFVKNN